MDDEDLPADANVQEEAPAPAPAASDPMSPHAHPNFVADLKRGADFMLRLIEKAPEPIAHLYDGLKEALQKHSV